MLWVASLSEPLPGHVAKGENRRYDREMARNSATASRRTKPHGPHLTARQHAAREAQILRLRKQGCSTEEVVEKTGFRRSYVAHVVTKLLRAGKIRRRRTGTGNLTARQHAAREAQIMRLRKQGRSNEEIVEETGFSPSYVSRVVAKLLQAGKIKRRSPALTPSTWRDLDDERVQTLIQMIKQRATLREIGDALGCSHERVRQVMCILREEYGEKIFAPEKPSWTTGEAAKLLGTYGSRVTALCRKGHVPATRRGSGPAARYLLDRKGLEVLRARLKQAEDR